MTITTRQSQTTDSAHGVATWEVTLSTRKVVPCVRWPASGITVQFIARPKAACELCFSYDTIRDAILTCARKPTWVSLTYRTETTTKKVEKQLGGDVQQPWLMSKYDVIHKPEVHNVSLRCQKRTELRPRPTDNVHKNLVKIGQAVRRYDRRDTHRHAHHNTPYRGVIIRCAYEPAL